MPYIRKPKNKTRKKRNPTVKWYEKIPGFRWISRTFKGVEISESQLPVEGGTLIIRSQNPETLGRTLSELGSLLTKKNVKIAFAPKGGRSVSLNIDPGKEEMDLSQYPPHMRAAIARQMAIGGEDIDLSELQ